MDSGISFKRLIIIVSTAFMVGVASPTLVQGSELTFQAVLSAFQEFSGLLKEMTEKIKEVNKGVNDVNRKLEKSKSFTDGFLKNGLSDPLPDFIKTSRKGIALFDDTMGSDDHIKQIQRKVGLAKSEAKNIFELEEEVRKAYVVLQDATPDNLKNGTVPSQKVSREDLARVHRQRGLLLRNASIKGITLSLEQQKEMYAEQSSEIFNEVEKYMKDAESAKDFAHVQTMVMLAVWSELRQQRQLLAALLQSQAAKNLHGDPLLVDISPAPRKRIASPKSESDKLSQEEEAFFKEINRLNEEYRKKHPSSGAGR